jgi:hypothetical protein
MRVSSESQPGLAILVLTANVTRIVGARLQSEKSALDDITIELKVAALT